MLSAGGKANRAWPHPRPGRDSQREKNPEEAGKTSSGPVEGESSSTTLSNEAESLPVGRHPCRRRLKRGRTRISTGKKGEEDSPIAEVGEKSVTSAQRRSPDWQEKVKEG